jgi:carboxyl-terminal processing protease
VTGQHGWLALALLLASGAAPALEERVVEEIRAVLQRHALTAPTPAQLAALQGNDLAAGLRAIDPWAVHIAKQDSAPDDAEAGIGAQLYRQDGEFWLMPYQGGPLARAGITDRVMLKEVDAWLAEARSEQQIAGLLRGAEGELVLVGVCAPGCPKVRRFTLAKQRFIPASVERVRIEGQPLLRIHAFVASETRSFLRTLLETLDGSRPLRIDLRDCQGGDLFEALDSAALFIESGAVLAELSGREPPVTRYQASAGAKFRQPLELLIGPGTASAGEVFAGILQAGGRARLVGQPSRGKCVSQTRETLSDGSLLHYTNLAIRFADGSSCAGSGLKPDRIVEAGMLDDSAELMEWLDF